VRGFPAAAVQKRPAFPDLFHQPDLVIVPDSGRLIAVFAYLIDSSNRRLSYEAVEDVFEAKLVIGASTVVACLMLNGVEIQRGKRELLYSALNLMYDVFGRFDARAPQQITQDFLPMLRNGVPNTNSAPIWAAERKIVSIQLKRFSEEEYEIVCDPERTPAFRGPAAQVHILDLLRDLFAGDAEINAVVGPPYSLAETLPGRNITRFDFAIGRTPVEFVTFELRSVMRRVHRLMAKARLLRYPHLPERFEPLRFVNPLLIVNGNIAGPLWDRFRYARALVSAGWEIVHVSRLESVPKLIDHGEF
jgi:hypothetical protein